MLKKILKFSVKALLTLVAVVLLLCCGIYFAASSERTQLSDSGKLTFAHRGQAMKAAENSIEAIELAVKENYTAIELDVRFTLDNRPVLFHDSDLKRMCKKEGSVEEYSFEDLQNFNLYFRNEQTENRIIDLESVFKKYPNLIFYLDIKTPTIEHLSIISDLIHAYKMEQNTIVAHAKFIPHILHRIKFPQIISCSEGFNSGKEWILKIIPQKLQSDYYASFLEKTDRKQMQRLENWGLANKKIAYGVDDNNLQKAVEEYGLQHIIVDMQNTENYLLKTEK